MRDGRAVAKAHESVHDRRRVDDDLDPAVRHAEEEVGLDHFQPLVRQRGRVDRDLRAHVPGRMSERIGRRHIRQLVTRAAAEWAAARGEDDRLRLAGERALEERGVLAVDRDQRPSPALPRAERELPGGDETLLVRERERDAVLERPHRSRQPREAQRRVEDDVRLGALQKLGRVAAHLRERREAVDRGRAGCGGHELERSVAGDDLDRLPPDRPSGTEKRDPRHGHSVPRHTRQVRALLLTLAVAAAVSALPAAAGSRIEGVPQFGHVFVLIGENTDYQHPDATDSPYLMGNLRPRSAWFSNYYAATHWSQANYVALTSGQFTPCEQKDLGYACRDDVDNVFHQLGGSSRSWHVWLEAGTAKCDTGSGGACTSNDPSPLTGFYTTGNPPIDYTNI